MQFDELCSSYEQVIQVGRSLSTIFMTQRKSNKLVINLVDKFCTKNNGGFNLANFKSELVQHYFDEVALDYSRSFIGSFIESVFKHLGQNTKVLMSISKYENHLGYNLTTNTDRVDEQLASLLQMGAIPEFVQVSCLKDVFLRLVDANLRN